MHTNHFCRDHMKQNTKENVAWLDDYYLLHSTTTDFSTQSKNIHKVLIALVYDFILNL